MATLKGIGGQTKGLVFEVTRPETTVGRHGTNMLVLADSSVSSFHCSIVKDGGRFTVRDLDSTNGTRVNGKPVKVSRLASSDIIQFGNVELLFEGADIEVETASDERAPRVPLKTSNVPASGRQLQAGFKPGKSYKGKIVWGLMGFMAVVGLILVIALFISLSRLK